MTRHHCPGDPYPGDQCPRCADRIDAHEAGPLASDVEAATRRAEGEFERYVYNEPRRQPAPMTRSEARYLDERRQMRRLREFMRGTA